MKKPSLNQWGTVAGCFSVIMILFLLWPLPGGLRFEGDQSPIEILDRNGKRLYQIRDENYGEQAHLTYSELPEKVVKVLLATEDKNFFSHPGISARGIGRAMWQNFTSGEIISGGSTLTQQLVRIGIKPEKRSYLYKIKEMLLALKLDQRFTKEEIIEHYLNRVYFGHQAYGIQAAAKTFFDKNVQELSLGETVFLIGLIQSPESYNPFYKLELAEKRKGVVVGILERSGEFTANEMEEIEETNIKLTSSKTDIQAPHFVMWLTEILNLPDRQAGKKFAQEKPHSVKTTLDLDLQHEAEKIVERHLETLKDKNVTSAAAVVLEVQTGEILAMVGSADYFDLTHDGAVNVAVAERQPGSALKPFTYALALKQGDTAATTIADIETQFFTQDGNPYVPRNYDYGYHGLVRYREALANSYNIAAVRVLEKVGVDSLLQLLKKVGISTLDLPPEHYGLALTLGSGEVKLLELAQAYGMFAKGGVTMNLTPFLEEPAPAGERVLDEKASWLITDILDEDQARLEAFGEGGPLEFDFPVAAKTGTTRNSRDNWTMGYTPEVVVGVWVGNADNSPMINTSGVTGAGPIFHELMVAAQKGRPTRPFLKPEGIYQQTVCKLSGKKPTSLCPAHIEEWFIRGTEPKEEDDLFQALSIDKRNGLLASETCPAEQTEQMVFPLFPPELQTWARENGWKMAPRGTSPLCPPSDVRKEKGENWIFIENPSPHESFLLDPLIPNEDEKIIFTATAGNEIEQIEWFINQEKVCDTQGPSFRCEWSPKKGKFIVRAKGGNVEEKVTIFVEK